MNARKPDPKSSTLNEQLLSYYSSKEVPSSLSELIAASKTPKPAAGDATQSPSKLGWFAIAAAVLISLFLAPVLFPGKTKRAVVSTQQLVRDLATEVAAHHVAASDPGVLTASFEEAAASLTKLDFELSPLPPALASYELKSAKHCSLYGQVAAQLKVTTPVRPNPVSVAPKSCTLYITRLSPELADIPDAETTVNGVKVRHIRYGGRLFVLAQDQ